MIARPQMFRKLLADVTNSLNQNSEVRKERAYMPGVTRKRVRQVARQIARREMARVRSGA